MYGDKCLVAEEKVQHEESTINIGMKQVYPRLQQYCRFLAQNSWDGDDLVQEVILKAVRHYDQTEINPALLKKIAYHYWIDTIRKRKQEVTGLTENIQESVNQSSVIETVELLMGRMTPKQSVIFTLKEAFHFQSAEIAGLLGTTEMAVKASLHRARKRLARMDGLREVETVHVDSEKQQLSSLLCASLHAEDPTVLVEGLHEIPSLAAVPTAPRSAYTSSHLSSFMMAA